MVKYVVTKIGAYQALLLSSSSVTDHAEGGLVLI